MHVRLTLTVRRSQQLKVTREEQEKMQQSIEKQQEAKSDPNSVTVMFHDRNVFLGATDSFTARHNAAPSLSGSLTVGVPVVCPVPSLSPSPKASAPRAHSRHRGRWRMTQHIEKFSAEVSKARSAWFGFRANPNTRSPQAAAIVITTMTEQRRCRAA